MCRQEGASGVQVATRQLVLQDRYLVLGSPSLWRALNPEEAALRLHAFNKVPCRPHTLTVDYLIVTPFRPFSDVFVSRLQGLKAR